LAPPAPVDPWFIAPPFIAPPVWAPLFMPVVGAVTGAEPPAAEPVPTAAPFEEPPPGPAPPVPLADCASAKLLESAKAVANAMVVSFIFNPLVRGVLSNHRPGVSFLTFRAPKSAKPLVLG
jgi:hypothetical protein